MGRQLTPPDEEANQGSAKVARALFQHSLARCYTAGQEITQNVNLSFFWSPSDNA